MFRMTIIGEWILGLIFYEEVVVEIRGITPVEDGNVISVLEYAWSCLPMEDFESLAYEMFERFATWNNEDLNMTHANQVFKLNCEFSFIASKLVSSSDSERLLITIEVY